MKFRSSLFLSLALLWPVTASALTVTNTADSGPGSLRQAVSQAPSGDTITFANGLSGEIIKLTTGQILIDKNLNIDASNLMEGITIDGNANERIFEITDVSRVVVDSLTLTNGYAKESGAVGGAIAVVRGATLTLNNSTLSGNSTEIGDGGGIFNDGTLTLNNSTLSDNRGTSSWGGGIFNGYGTLTLNNSTLSGNSASNGGGIYNHGTLTLNNSTLSGNSASNGGGIDNYGLLTLNNSTLSGNSAYLEGGGIDTYVGTLTLNNSIVAGNTLSFDLPDNISGEIKNSNYHNITSGDPMLEPLGDYGGPTQTMPPKPGSPAINGGLKWNTVSLADQRGLTRLVGKEVDIGAVEIQPIIVMNNRDSGLGSLRQAISDSPGGATITFNPFLDGQTIVLESGQFLIRKDLNIDASNLTHGIIIDGNRNGGIFGIVSNATVVFDSLTLTNARTDVGGAISINTGANLTLNNATLSGNSASSGGGGIFNWGTLTINNSTLSGNSALSLGGVGGGIFNAGTLTINKSTLSGNSAFVDGGGILNAGTLVLTNSTLSDNSAKWGGGIDNHGPLTLNNSTLSGNSAVNEFGGIRSTGFTPILNNSIVAGNSSTSGELNISALFTGGNNLTSGNPLLAPLGDYGGPTQTMPPLPGSPAIDRGGATTLTSDQRGFSRVGPPDIGAAERGGSASFPPLENAGMNANGVFEVTVPNGMTADIEYSPDLINWEIIATGITGTFVETNAGRRSAPTGFYRASQN